MGPAQGQYEEPTVRQTYQTTKIYRVIAADLVVSTTPRPFRHSGMASGPTKRFLDKITPIN